MLWCASLHITPFFVPSSVRLCGFTVFVYPFTIRRTFALFPCLAVMNSAALYGLDPGILQARYFVECLLIWAKRSTRLL